MIRKIILRCKICQGIGTKSNGEPCECRYFGGPFNKISYNDEFWEVFVEKDVINHE